MATSRDRVAMSWHALRSGYLSHESDAGWVEDISYYEAMALARATAWTRSTLQSDNPSRPQSHGSVGSTLPARKLAILSHLVRGTWEEEGQGD